MVKYRRPYEPSRLGNPELARAKKEAYLRRQAKQLGFALTLADGAVAKNMRLCDAYNINVIDVTFCLQSSGDWPTNFFHGNNLF